MTPQAVEPFKFHLSLAHSPAKTHCISYRSVLCRPTNGGNIMKSDPAHHQHLSQSGGIDRRTFLRALGCVVALGGSGLLGTRDADAQRFVLREENFGRLFPQLDPFFEQASSGLNAALLDIGKPGGVLDANDDLAAGPAALIVDPALSVNNPNNPTHTAGTTFMGQFMDHDMSFDLTSRLGEPTEPEDSPNARTPALDLDSVYGGGPRRSPELYEQTGGSRIKFKVESGGLFEDLPRTSNNTAIIADPRNDENLIIAGLHAAFPPVSQPGGGLRHPAPPPLGTRTRCSTKPSGSRSGITSG
jgi:hypothetical protein